ncbi:MAG: tRNA lysidine(34) synthetase TilS [Pseudomonadota bacterium]
MAEAAGPHGIGGPDATAGAVAAALERLAPDAGLPLGLAVSGGSDSVALMLLAADWARERARGLHVLTVDHGLRAAAAGETAAVCRLATALGLSVSVLNVCVARQGNVAAAARDARLAALSDWSARVGGAPVALAHTLDDQAETVVMRLARRAGADGLAAMDEHRAPFVRPLLGLGRAALRHWLRARDVGWIDDPSNADPAAERVRARRALATLSSAGPSATDIAASADRLRAQVAVLDWACDRLAADAEMGRNAAGAVDFDPIHVADAPGALSCRLIARAVWQLTGRIYPPRGEALARACEAVIAAGRGARLPETPLALGCVIQGARRGDRPVVAIAREHAACMPPMVLSGETPFSWDRRLRLSPPFPSDAVIGPLGRHAPDVVEGLGPAWRLDHWSQAGSAARASAPVLRDRAGALLAVATPFGWAARPGIAPPATVDLVAERSLSRRSGPCLSNPRDPA